VFSSIHKYNSEGTPVSHFTTSRTDFGKWIKKGSISMVELSEVNTPYEVKKWVKIDKSKNTYNSKSETKQEGKEMKSKLKY